MDRQVDLHRFVRPRFEAVPHVSRDAGSSKDATVTSATTVVDRRPAEQRPRHQRARERSSQTLPTALLPLPEGPFRRHDLGPMTLQSPICSGF
ncbi:BQ5605_C003g02533 [Microbotryum silenes-dioicae]|uniref:BQ5605_C003g02533 protein n=1 Tax=Microbotryum silenes-dioicae TaxID=796604 RepID=A0A2X0M5Y1_9BASI|nr:BQ5605_C003g02533 [Microbotryum silenes-dioicae]